MKIDDKTIIKIGRMTCTMHAQMIEIAPWG
jgi:hypothetical protein